MLSSCWSITWAQPLGKAQKFFVLCWVVVWREYFWWNCLQQLRTCLIHTEVDVVWERDKRDCLTAPTAQHLSACKADLLRRSQQHYHSPISFPHEPHFTGRTNTMKKRCAGSVAAKVIAAFEVVTAKRPIQYSKYDTQSSSIFHHFASFLHIDFRNVPKISTKSTIKKSDSK